MSLSKKSEFLLDYKDVVRETLTTAELNGTTNYKLRTTNSALPARQRRQDRRRRVVEEAGVPEVVRQLAAELDAREQREPVRCAPLLQPVGQAGSGDVALQAGRVGAMLQGGALLPDVTVRELVAMFQKNFAKFEQHVTPDIKAAAPEFCNR